MAASLIHILWLVPTKLKLSPRKIQNTFAGGKENLLTNFYETFRELVAQTGPGRFGVRIGPLAGRWGVVDGSKGGDVGDKRKVFPNFLAGFCKSCCHRPAKDEINVFPQK